MSKIQTLKLISQNIHVLYVEDSPDLLKSVAQYLQHIFPVVDTALNGKIALEVFKKKSYDIVITDIQMPIMNGLEMIEEIQKIKPEQEILITTAFSEVDYLLKSIELNVAGYLVKPINFDKINTLLEKTVNRINMLKENVEYKFHLEDLVTLRSQETLALKEEKIDNYEKTLLALVGLVEKRDAYTGGHSLRVAHYSQLIAQNANCTENECALIYRAGILHDIGKIETPDAVLLNPGKLDELEFNIIREHAATGAKILANIPMYKTLAKIIGQHHEKYDGSGYPDALKGSEIEKLAHILMIADAFDAMTTNRIYKPRMSLENALGELEKYAGTQFHPDIAKVAIEVFKEIKLDTNIFQLPSTVMENKKFAFFYEDQLTKAYNKRYLETYLVQSNTQKKYLNLISMHNFGKYNKTYGWSEGDNILKTIVQILQKNYKESLIFRIQGDDFIIISDNDIKIELSLFETLLQESHNILRISHKSIDIKKSNLSSTKELMKYLT
ncbi:MAG: response regulator [Sulfurimonas sp.]|nr:response regulator [Sulfurimonas sp.]